MASIFTKIINRDIPAYIVAEDERHIAILDIHPLVEGHTLVIPKMEVDYLFDLDEASYVELNLFSRKVARAIESVVPCIRIGIAVIGLEVPHAHIHLVPLNSMGDINFSNPKLRLTNDQFERISKKINEAFKKL